MKIAPLAVLALVFHTSSVFAGADLNPSQLETSDSMSTYGVTRMPIGYYQYCQKYRSECVQETTGETLNLTQQRWQQMLDVNFSVNVEIEPKTDMEIYGREEAWEIPTNEGDCEDYALLKKKRLNDLGFPKSSLLITVGLDANRGGHAVLTVATDSGDFILDNVEKKVLKWADAEIYFLKRQSPHDPNAWESLVIQPENEGPTSSSNRS